VSVLEAGALDDFMRRHRIRYAGGMDAATADLLRQETGADGAVFVALTLSSEAFPPKIALIARLVSTRDTPLVVWSNDVSMAGDDAPGWFELGIVGDYGTLLTRALDRLTAPLADYLETGAPGAVPRSASKFRPKMSYKAEGLEPAKTVSIAVLPFLNLSPRRNAGEILGLLYARHLAAFSRFRVFDAGVVRRELLSARIIMDAGPSITDAETVAALVEADFVLGGRVLVFEDFEGGEGTTRVEFSTVIIERRTRKVVWSSDSYNSGRDGVLFFERGRSRTAQLMATQMVGLTTEKIAGDGK
jgi:TolB-like protein